MQSTIRKYIVSIFFVFGITNTSAQTKKTIIIDTLIGYTLSKNEFNIPIVQRVPEKGEELLIADGFNPKVNISDKNPNVIITELDSKNVALLLDDKGGLLKLLSLDKMQGDTIKINKWIVYKNGLTDTIRTNTAYFQMYNDSMANEPYKVKQTFRFKNNTGKKNIHEIDVVMNDKLYEIPIAIITIQPRFPATFHGYFPRKKYKSFNQKRIDDKKIYRYKAFMGEEFTLIQCFDATFDWSVYK